MKCAKRQNACKIVSDNSDIMVEYRRFQPNPPAFRAPFGLTPLNFANIIGVTKGHCYNVHCYNADVPDHSRQ